MDSDLVPATAGAVTPVGGSSAVVKPAVPAAPKLPASVGGGNVPAPNNSASREIAKPAGGNVPTSLSAISVLDMIRSEMTQLNTELARLGEQLVPLNKTAEAIDAVVSNVDEISKLYEAPLMTRSATDAASAVAAHMADMVDIVRQHALQVQMSNAQAFLALNVMINVQDSQRAQGAGPRLLASAGH